MNTEVIAQANLTGITDMPLNVGKTVASIQFDTNHADPRVTIEFTDGSKFVVTETQQSGDIDCWTEG